MQIDNFETDFHAHVPTRFSDRSEYVGSPCWLLMTTAMWGVVARIAAAAAILTLVQHNISQMYKAYYDERMKEEAGPTKMFPKREEDADVNDDNGGARSARGGGGSRGERGGRRSFSTATAASVGAWAAAAVTSDALASHRRMNAPASASGVIPDPRHVTTALRAARRLR
jgi:hypothetical protein